MHKKTVAVPALLTLILLTAGCSLPQTSLLELLTPAPVYWTDPEGIRRQVEFSQGGGSDLHDAYLACGKDENCYKAYFEANEAGYKRRPGRGRIRLHTKGSNIRVYAEHHMDNRTDEMLAPFCYLTMHLDQHGAVTDTEFTQ